MVSCSFSQLLNISLLTDQTDILPIKYLLSVLDHGVKYKNTLGLFQLLIRITLQQPRLFL